MSQIFQSMHNTDLLQPAVPHISHCLCTTLTYSSLLSHIFHTVYAQHWPTPACCPTYFTLSMHNTDLLQPAVPHISHCLRTTLTYSSLLSHIFHTVYAQHWPTPACCPTHFTLSMHNTDLLQPAVPHISHCLCTTLTYSSLLSHIFHTVYAQHWPTPACCPTYFTLSMHNTDLLQPAVPHISHCLRTTLTYSSLLSHIFHTVYAQHWPTPACCPTYFTLSTHNTDLLQPAVPHISHCLCTTLTYSSLLSHTFHTVYAQHWPTPACCPTYFILSMHNTDLLQPAVPHISHCLRTTLTYSSLLSHIFHTVYAQHWPTPACCPTYFTLSTHNTDLLQPAVPHISHCLCTTLTYSSLLSHTFPTVYAQHWPTPACCPTYFTLSMHNTDLLQPAVPHISHCLRTTLTYSSLLSHIFHTVYAQHWPTPACCPTYFTLSTHNTDLLQPAVPHISHCLCTTLTYSSLLSHIFHTVYAQHWPTPACCPTYFTLSMHNTDLLQPAVPHISHCLRTTLTYSSLLSHIFHTVYAQHWPTPACCPTHFPLSTHNTDLLQPAVPHISHCLCTTLTYSSLLSHTFHTVYAQHWPTPACCPTYFILSMHNTDLLQPAVPHISHCLRTTLTYSSLLSHIFHTVYAQHWPTPACCPTYFTLSTHNTDLLQPAVPHISHCLCTTLTYSSLLSHTFPTVYAQHWPTPACCPTYFTLSMHNTDLLQPAVPHISHCLRTTLTYSSLLSHIFHTVYAQHWPTPACCPTYFTLSTHNTDLLQPAVPHISHCLCTTLTYSSLLSHTFPTVYAQHWPTPACCPTYFTLSMHNTDLLQPAVPHISHCLCTTLTYSSLLSHIFHTVYAQHWPTPACCPTYFTLSMHNTDLLQPAVPHISHCLCTTLTYSSLLSHTFHTVYAQHWPTPACCPTYFTLSMHNTDLLQPAVPHISQSMHNTDLLQPAVPHISHCLCTTLTYSSLLSHIFHTVYAQHWPTPACCPTYFTLSMHNTDLLQPAVPHISHCQCTTLTYSSLLSHIFHTVYAQHWPTPACCPTHFTLSTHNTDLLQPAVPHISHCLCTTLTYSSLLSHIFHSLCTTLTYSSLLSHIFHTVYAQHWPTPACCPTYFTLSMHNTDLLQPAVPHISHCLCTTLTYSSLLSHIFHSLCTTLTYSSLLSHIFQSMHNTDLLQPAVPHISHCLCTTLTYSSLLSHIFHTVFTQVRVDRELRQVKWAYRRSYKLLVRRFSWVSPTQRTTCVLLRQMLSSHTPSLCTPRSHPYNTCTSGHL